MIPASDVWNVFREKINSPQSSPLNTWDIGRLYEWARAKEINDLIYNWAKKQSPKDEPPNAVESDISLLDEIKVRLMAETTQSSGFWPYPQNLHTLGTVLAYKKYEDCPNPLTASNLVLVRYYSTNEFGVRLANPFTKPTWDEPELSPFERYLPEYETGTSATTPGINMLPVPKVGKPYRLLVEYWRKPEHFVIANTPDEFTTMNPTTGTHPSASFEYNPANINCPLHPKLFPQIMDRMVAEYHLRKGNLQMYQLTQGAAATGN